MTMDVDSMIGMMIATVMVVKGTITVVEEGTVAVVVVVAVLGRGLLHYVYQTF